jgi:hypothetical protein
VWSWRRSLGGGGGACTSLRGQGDGRSCVPGERTEPRCQGDKRAVRAPREARNRSSGNCPRE